MESQELVLIKKMHKEEVPITTSVLIAEKTKNTQKSIQNLINNHILSLEKFGRVVFEILPLETKGGIQDHKIYYLNEQQATLLVTFMRNNEIVINFKIELVKQFFQMKQLLLQKSTTEWQESREDTKLFQKELGDTIKQFEIHCISQGSTSHKRYYNLFADLINSLVGIKSGQRDYSDRRILYKLNLALQVTKSIILEEISNGTFYKEIYQICKKELSKILIHLQPRLAIQEINV